MFTFSFVYQIEITSRQFFILLTCLREPMLPFTQCCNFGFQDICLLVPTIRVSTSPWSMKRQLQVSLSTVNTYNNNQCLRKQSISGTSIHLNSVPIWWYLGSIHLSNSYLSHTWYQIGIFNEWEDGWSYLHTRCIILIKVVQVHVRYKIVILLCIFKTQNSTTHIPGWSKTWYYSWKFFW